MASVELRFYYLYCCRNTGKLDNIYIYSDELSRRSSWQLLRLAAPGRGRGVTEEPPQLPQLHLVLTSFVPRHETGWTSEGCTPVGTHGDCTHGD